MNINEYDQTLETWKIRHNKWIIAADIIAAAIALTITLIATLAILQENYNIFLKSLTVLGSLTVTLTALFALNILNSTIFNKIAKHQTNKQYIKKQIKWIEEYSNYHQATQGRKPTEAEAITALTTWYKNQPTQNS